MAYTLPPTRSSANQIISADWNTYVRDNFIEVEARKETDNVESNSSTTVSATTAATANTVLTATPFTPNGTDRYRIEFFAAQVTLAANAGGNSIIFHLYDGAVNIGRIGVYTNSANTTLDYAVYLRREYAPSNASHTFSVRAHRTNANCTVVHGAGGADVVFPYTMTITRLP